MPPKTYKGKQPETFKGKRTAGSSSRFNTERFKDADCAERFESRFTNRTVIFERIVVHSELTHTGFLHWLHLNGLMILMNLNNECFEDWVREFYCNMYDVNNSGFKTYVRGKTLVVNANSIATLLSLRRPVHRSYPTNDLDNIMMQANEMATELCGKPTVLDTPGLKIFGLTTDYWLLNTFVCHNIEPISHRSDLIYSQAFLLYSLGTGTSIDIQQAILESMLRVYNEQRKITLPFGAVICKLMIEEGCQAYTHELPVARRQEINGRTKAMSDTHVARHLQRGQAPDEADNDAEANSIENRLLVIEHTVFDQSIQIEQLDERMATGFSDIRNQLTEMFNQLRHQ